MERFENNKTSTVLLLKLQIQRLQDVYAHTTNVLTNYGQYMSPQNLMELSKKLQTVLASITVLLNHLRNSHETPALKLVERPTLVPLTTYNESTMIESIGLIKQNIPSPEIPYVSPFDDQSDSSSDSETMMNLPIEYMDFFGNDIATPRNKYPRIDEQAFTSIQYNNIALNMISNFATIY